MGRGNRSHERGVRKRVTIYSKTSGGGEGGSAPQQREIDECLFSISLGVKTKIKETNFKVDDPVALVLGESNRIDIFIKNISVTEYLGTKKQKIIECISNNYAYTGKVVSIKKEGIITVLSVLIHGNGR